MARARTKLSTRELVELYDYVKFTRADGRCECEGDCGRSHRFGIHYRCPNAHGRPGVHGSDKMISLRCAYLDGDTTNTLDTNLMAMCQGCATRRGAHRRGETKRVEKRKRIEAQHDSLFELAPVVSDQTAGVNEL